jgi:hypothetical protein
MRAMGGDLFGSCESMEIEIRGIRCHAKQSEPVKASQVGSWF